MSFQAVGWHDLSNQLTPNVLPLKSALERACFDSPAKLIFEKRMPLGFLGAFVVRLMAFESGVERQIADLGQGYPYFVQLIGKQCVNEANHRGTKVVDGPVWDQVLDDLKQGRAFPTLEAAYQRAIGNSPGRQLLLHLLADQKTDETLFTDEIGRIVLKKARQDAEELDVQHVDQLIPRLIDHKYGPVLERVQERQGTYEFVNPVLRRYIRLREF